MPVLITRYSFRAAVYTWRPFTLKHSLCLLVRVTAQRQSYWWEPVVLRPRLNPITRHILEASRETVSCHCAGVACGVIALDEIACRRAVGRIIALGLRGNRVREAR